MINNEIQKEKSFYLPTLDGWRAISILMVLIYHAAWFKHGPDAIGYDYSTWKFFQAGIYGVSTFFTISGYLITSRILHEVKTYGFFSAKDFYIKRFFRIFPPFYAFMMTLIVLNYFFQLGTTFWDIVTSLTFLRIYHLSSTDWYTSHVWSLCVEEHYYVILSVYFLLWKQVKTKWYIMGSFLLVILFNVLSFRYQHLPGIESARNYLKVLKWMDFMFAGSLFAYFTNSFEEIRETLKKFQVAFFLLLFVMFFKDFPLKTVIMPLYTALIIYLTTLNPNKWILGLLENRVMRFVGKISYSLYLWQQLFLVTQTSSVKELVFFQSFPNNLIFIFICAYLSYRFIEVPMIKVGRRYLQHT